MCGRFTLTEPGRIGTRFGIQAPLPADEGPRYNVAPSQSVLTVVVAEHEGRALRQMRWGFQPAWMKEAKRPPPINARAETLLDRPMFRGALGHSRCLIPADGFYEWVATEGSKQKQPLHLRLKGGELFGFAGLWTEASDGEPTCVIVTTEANELIRPLHARMPVILEPADEPLWLDPEVTDPAAVSACLQSFPSERMELYRVSDLVSSARNEGPELVQPALL